MYTRFTEATDCRGDLYIYIGTFILHACRITALSRQAQMSSEWKGEEMRHIVAPV